MEENKYIHSPSVYAKEKKGRKEWRQMEVKRRRRGR